MLARSVERGTLVALLFLVLIAPYPSFAVKATQNRPIAIFADPGTPEMPLPTPTPGYVPEPVPISGVIRILVIAAAFSDINYTLSITTIKQNFFGTVGAYYREISYGAVTIQGDALGWYKLPYPEAHYGRDCQAIDDADCTGSDGSWQIAQDAAQLAQNDVNLNNYDYFVFIHSGMGEESSGVKDDVWSVTYLGGVYVRTNARTLMKFNVDPELEAGGAVPFGVYCHEFGHQLGLPDLYNTNNGRTILGPWELMDKGLWNGDPRGSSPAHMTAWDKIQLGFISGSMLATANSGVTSTFTVDPTEVASSNVHAIMIPISSTTDPAQYYLVEVRTQTGFDSALPASGVLITYVDSTAIIGRVHVMDGHPAVANLNDAVWNVGQTFTDSNNNLAVTVTGQVGNAFQITVNRSTGQPPPPIQNQAYIDLAITNINTQPQVITNPNTTVTINIQISNLGNTGATNVPVQVTLDGQTYTSLQIASIAGGSSTQTSFTWISTLGSHVFQVTVDPNNIFNDTNRANNVATFNVSVGPTLTINVPSNVTSAGMIWVSVNGMKYNLTSSQLQLSVPNGTIIVQIQPAVNMSLGVRQLFSKWLDGNFANPRQIAVTSNTVIQAVYATQYLLTVYPSGGSTTTSNWYYPGTNAAVSASNPSNVTANASRMLFNGWSGDVNSTSTYLHVVMTKPVYLRANWIRQYYVTIISPTGSPTGSGWYNAGQIATVGVQSTVQYSNGTRKIFTGWNSTTLGQNPTAQITVNAPTAIRAGWKSQYLVNVQSQYGTALGSGWYDAGSSIPISVQPMIDYGNATRRMFQGWAGDTTSSSPNMTLRVNSPKVVNAQWSTQYRITFKVNGVPNATILKLGLNSASYDLSVNRNYQAWYSKGTAINPMLNQTLVDGFMIYKFSGWRNSTGGTIEAPLTVNSPQTFVASYSTELNLPPIPGFPIESILLGIFLGAVFMGFTKRRRRRKTT